MAEGEMAALARAPLRAFVNKFVAGDVGGPKLPFGSVEDRAVNEKAGQGQLV
jgi:hypothetical protein